MHEFSLAESMLGMALAQMNTHRATRLEKINLRIGRLSGVVAEALEFAFEALSEGTPAQGAVLDIEDVPVSCYCQRCAAEFTAPGYSYQCPTCGELSREVRRGREMDLLSIEVT